jgi:broad specificity phosphatase PhoE
MRRWRGFKDVPLTEEAEFDIELLRADLGKLDAIYHDRLHRCRDTAYLLDPEVCFEDPGPEPWNMGQMFEGREITEVSLDLAKYYVRNPYARPPGGETFAVWAFRWKSWIESLNPGYAAVGVVTHNRNIQYLYSLYEGKFCPHLYDVDGPDFCTVHVYRDGHIAPWGGKHVPNGIYLIRHGETEYGT